jgi:hypothetical protein
MILSLVAAFGFPRLLLFVASLYLVPSCLQPSPIVSFLLSLLDGLNFRPLLCSYFLVSRKSNVGEFLSLRRGYLTPIKEDCFPSLKHYPCEQTVFSFHLGVSECSVSVVLLCGSDS